MQVLTKRISMDLATFIRKYREEERFLGCCQACENYEKRWSCPPYSFKPLDYMKSFQEIEVVLHLIDFQGESVTDQESFVTLKKERVRIDRELLEWEKSVPGSRVFFPGSCTYCPPGQCARRWNLPCIHPDSMRYSLESFGFNIEQILEELFGEKLLWAKDGIAPAHYTLVSAMML